MVIFEYHLALSRDTTPRGGDEETLHSPKKNFFTIHKNGSFNKFKI
jgi:hypothetical protein